MIRRCVRFSLFLLCFASTAHAATVVRAGRLIDVDSGQVRVDQAVRIDQGRIVSIAPWSAQAASHAELVDWSRFTVLPGLMDMHTHISEEAQSADPAGPLKSTP